MLEKEYRFLLRAAKVMNHDRVFSVKDIPQEDLLFLHELRRHNLLYKLGGGLWKIPKPAYDELRAKQEADEHRSKDAADDRNRQQAQSNVAIKSAIIGAVIGAVVTGLVGFFFSLITP